MAAKEADLATTDGVGGVIAASVVAWFGEDGNQAAVERCRRRASTSATSWSAG